LDKEITEMETKTALVVATGGSDYLSKAGIARRFDVSTRTIDRWKRNKKLDFPPADLVINQREYHKLKTVEQWERRRATAPST
jgi:DNA-binding transcriptional regulator YiaG